MPRAAATAFRPGRRSHRGRPGRRSHGGRPGRRGNRGRARVDCAGRCSTSSEAASPVSAASRSLKRRARAASARASALATSSSVASAPGLSGSCTENELITSVRPHPRCRTAAIVTLTCGNARPAASEAEWVGVARRRPPSGSDDLLQPGEFSFRMWHSNRVRSFVAVAAALLGASVLAAPPSSAGPTVCDYPACTPGIMPHQVLGAPCENTTYYAFGVDDSNVPPAAQPGRLMFCGSPRRYQPRWFRSPPMAGVKEENSSCENFQNYVAQAPDGLFLICYAHDGILSWIRADT